MFVKKTIVTALSLGFVFAAHADDASDLKDLKEIVAKQQAQLETLNKQVKEQDTSNKEAVAQYVKTEVDAQMKAQKSILGLGKHISSLKIGGDLRLRYQHEDSRDDVAFATGTKVWNPTKDNGYIVNPSFNPANPVSTTNSPTKKATAGGYDDVKGKESQRNRFRQRLRIGMEWTSKDENWTVGTGLATGSTDGRSTNDTYGDEAGMQAYEHGDIRIDYAFARMNFSQKEDDFYSALTMGQQKNPYLSSFIFNDGDLNPIGVTYQYNIFTGGNADMKINERPSWFNTFGVYTVDHRNSGRETSDIIVLQAQTGYRGEAGVVALGFSHYSENVRDTNLDGGINDPTDIQDKDYGYSIVDGYGEFKAWEDGANSIKLLGHVGYNLAASDKATQTGVKESDGMKYGEGLAYYGAVEGKFSDFKASYGWAHVEADALPIFMVDSDFAHGSTNYQGHVIKLGYSFSKNLELGVTALLAKTIEDNLKQRDEHDLYQLDMVWKF